MKQTRKRILLGQLGSNGDCLYATTIARQIKVDYPNCHLTWAISSRCRPIIEGNPDIDAVWEIPSEKGTDMIEEWRLFEIEVAKKKKAGQFDEIFLTQISTTNHHLWVGSMRSSIFRAYPHPITIDDSPILNLFPEEVENVRRFAERHRLSEKCEVILFECAPQSGQSFVTPDFALKVARQLVEMRQDIAVILSSGHSFVTDHPNIINANVLSLRENAELTRYCSFLIGASSGITWISTSTWGKMLPTIQLIVPDLTFSNSLTYDFQKRGVDTSHIIEMHACTPQDVVACMSEIWNQNFATAKAKYNRLTPLRFEHYRAKQYYFLVTFQWKKCKQFMELNIKEHGFRLQFVTIFLAVLLKVILIAPFKLALKLKRRIFAKAG